MQPKIIHLGSCQLCRERISLQARSPISKAYQNIQKQPLAKPEFQRKARSPLAVRTSEPATPKPRRIRRRLSHVSNVTHTYTISFRPLLPPTDNASRTPVCKTALPFSEKARRTGHGRHVSASSSTCSLSRRRRRNLVTKPPVTFATNVCSVHNRH